MRGDPGFPSSASTVMKASGRKPPVTDGMLSALSDGAPPRLVVQPSTSSCACSAVLQIPRWTGAAALL